MNIFKTLLFIFIITLFSACSNKQTTVVDYKENDFYEKKQIQITQDTNSNNSFLDLNKKEKEFLEILKNDSFASLCSSKEKYHKILKLQDTKEISKNLEELFYEYTNNLENSCINQKRFQRTLKTKKYKEKKQIYETYNKKINKKNLLKLYRSEKLSIKSILKNYTPKHPDFFKMIKLLDKKKLSKTAYYKLRLNIERLKLLKYYKSNNFIQLNIPSYNFALYENNKKTKSFGTVVGSNKDQTPILSSKLSYFIINPAWNIPDSIAKKSVIPKALKDKNYLKKKNIVIRKNYKQDSQKFKFKDIKWKKYLKKDVKYIPYKFIQLPSKTNGMGRVKFMFKNDYAVYMHDTIGSWRFKINKEKIRSVSHGCVRLEHPISLMRHLSKKYTPKTYKSVRKIYDKEETASVSLSKKLPIHITYITSYIKKGKVKFYKDIYSYDKIQKLNFNPFI